VKIDKCTFLLTLIFLLGTHGFATLEQIPDNQQASYEQALALARSGQYPSALAIFQQLSPLATNPNILYDHAIVLTWSGDYAAAISLYEDQILFLPSSIPSYVKTSIAGAYYRLSQFKKAQQLFHEVALSGDRPAKRWEAESFMRMKDIKSANHLYQELLTSAPSDIDTYLSRASLFLLLGNTVSAAVDVNQALEQLPNNLEGQERSLQIRADMAASFIQHDDYNRAIILLQPTIANGSATMKMQANYILALKLNTDYKRAIQQGVLLWPDFTLVPDFGLQALADCYLRVREPAIASTIYRIILTRHNPDTNSNTITLSLAYADLRDGNIQKGLEEYQHLLPTNPTFGPIASMDANSFIEAGQIDTGKKLYQLLLTTVPDTSFYLKSYGAILSENDMPREAYHQYEKLNELNSGDRIALSGLVTTATVFGDYKTARAATRNLKEKYPLYSIPNEFVAKDRNYNLKSIQGSYQMLHDYKGNQVTETDLMARQHGDGRFSILANTNYKKISDTTSSTTLPSYGLGLQYEDVTRDVQLWIKNYYHNNTFTGYHLLANHYFDDRAFIEINIEKSPIEDVQALTFPIMSTTQQLTLNRKLGLKDFYTLSLTSSNYSDGNHSTTYGTTFDHTLLTTKTKSANWFAYGNRTHYKYQLINATSTPYESPMARETYGLGITEHWDMENRYWKGTVTAEWGRDRPEDFSFSPNIAMEYGYIFSPTHSLQLGAQYNFHTDTSVISKNLGFGSRQYYINYNRTW
jgi:tetratricopeptide (TPR) repeat protein